MRILLTLALFTLLPGCAPLTPVVSGINRDSVQVQHHPLLGDPAYHAAAQAEGALNIQAEADRACGVYGRLATQPISTRCIEKDMLGLCLRQETLFACGHPDGQD